VNISLARRGGFYEENRSLERADSARPQGSFPKVYNLLPSASLATMLVLSVAREKGVILTGRDVLRAGIRTTPFVLAIAVVVLAATFLVKP
jgi:hypothetical protein